MFNNRKCPYCAETVKQGAVVCKHCGRDIPGGSQTETDNQSSIGETLPGGRRTVVIAAVALVVLVIGGITVSTIVRQRNLQIEYAIQQTQVAMGAGQSGQDSSVEESAPPTASILPTPSKTPRPREIRQGQTQIIPEVCAITVLGSQFTSRVLPPNTSGYYRYYEVKKPNAIFLDVTVDVTNLDTIVQTADRMVNVTLVYNNEDNYGGTLVMVDPNGDFTYGSIYGIEPKLSAQYHYIFEVPDSIQYSSKSMVMRIQPVDGRSSQDGGFEYRIR